jgi:hypothetical protein
VGLHFGQDATNPDACVPVLVNQLRDDLDAVAAVVGHDEHASSAVLGRRMAKDRIGSA